ncbi:MAG: MFS transporter [Chloroflexota bacterium]
MTTLTIEKPNYAQKLLAILTTGHLVNDFYNVTLPFLLPTLIMVFDLSFFQAGLLAIATSLLSGVLQPIVGHWADFNSKRKPVMMIGFVAFSLGLMVAGLSVSYAMVLLAFFIFGLGQTTFHPQSTNFITNAFPDAKGRAMGIHGIGGSIGNFSAPLAVTFLLTAFGWRYALFFLAIPGLLMLPFLGGLLSEPPKPKEIVRQTFQVTPILILLSLNFALIFMAYRGFLIFLPTYLVETGSTLQQAGYIAALMLFVGFLAQPIGGYVYDRLGGRFVMIVTSILTGVAILLFTMDSGLPSLIFIIIVGMAGTATFPVSLAMASDVSDGKNVGANVGFVFGASGVLGAFIPAITGYAADNWGLQLSFRLLVIVAVASLVMALFLPGHKPQTSKNI